MTPELQKQLAEMLAKLTNATTDTAAWAQAQAQAGPLVHEKILFGRVDETLLLILMASAFGVAAYLCYLCIRTLRAGDLDDDAGIGYVIGAVVSGFVGGMLAMFGSYQLHVTLMVWFAPRLYIVEWLKEMIK